MEFWIDLFWQLVIVVVVTAVVTFAWAFASAKLNFLNKPYRLTEDGGAIRPWPPLWIVMGLFLTLVVVGGIGAAIAQPTPGMIVTMTICTIIVGPLAVLSLLSATPPARLAWNAHGVEGLSSGLWGPRNEIAWASIERVKPSLGGAYFLEDVRGRRIYWSVAYVGQHYFLNALVSKRADLLAQTNETMGADA